MQILFFLFISVYFIISHSIFNLSALMLSVDAVFIMLGNVLVVGNVGGLKTEPPSHGKLLLKYKKPAYPRINPNIFNHVLANVRSEDALVWRDRLPLRPLYLARTRCRPFLGTDSADGVGVFLTRQRGVDVVPPLRPRSQAA